MIYENGIGKSNRDLEVFPVHVGKILCKWQASAL